MIFGNVEQFNKISEKLISSASEQVNMLSKCTTMIFFKSNYTTKNNYTTSLPEADCSSFWKFFSAFVK